MLAVIAFYLYNYCVIRIINYKRGNLNNVLKAFLNFGFEAEIIDKPEDVMSSYGLVLPGVGAFGDAMKTMNETGFSTAVKEYIASGKPFLGICLGLQLLFEQSNEFGEYKGLGVFKGVVKKFVSQDLKIPHMGWNQATIKKNSPLLKGIDNKTFFYFVHSYYVEPEDDQIVLTTTNYGQDFVSSVQSENVIATQFHIEKSQENGLKIIKNFGEHCVSNTRN